MILSQSLLFPISPSSGKALHYISLPRSLLGSSFAWLSFPFRASTLPHLPLLHGLGWHSPFLSLLHPPFLSSLAAHFLRNSLVPCVPSLASNFPSSSVPSRRFGSFFEAWVVECLLFSHSFFSITHVVSTYYPYPISFVPYIMANTFCCYFSCRSRLCA